MREVIFALIPLAITVGVAIVRRRNASIEDLHPEMQRRALLWLAYLRGAGIKVRFRQTLRKAEEQAKKVAQGRSQAKVSYHQSGLAIDFEVLEVRGEKIQVYSESQRNPDPTKIAAELAALREAGELAERAGLRWGGRWTKLKDSYHVELDTPVKMAEALARYQRQGRAFSLEA